MLVFLICVFFFMTLVFGVLGYGSINRGQMFLFTGLSCFCLLWVVVLALVLAMGSNSSTVVREADGSPPLPSTPPQRASPIAPQPPPTVVPANLPDLVEQGTSYHLNPTQSTPLFRAPIGKRTHVAIYGGAASFYSGGQLKRSCAQGGFEISGQGDGDQIVACSEVVDVLFDRIE